LSPKSVSFLDLHVASEKPNRSFSAVAATSFDFPDNQYYSSARLRARYYYSKLRFEHRAAIYYGGKTGKIFFDQQTRSVLVFASSTRSIPTTRRHIHGDSDAQQS
jgi:hypothetical protein